MKSVSMLVLDAGRKGRLRTHIVATQRPGRWFHGLLVAAAVAMFGCEDSTPGVERAGKPDYAALLRSWDTDKRLAAVRLIGAGKDPADSEFLIEAMKNDEVEVRLNAVVAAWRRQDQQCLAALSESLRDEDARVRCTAASALAALDSDHAPDKLAGLLKDKNVGVRLYAAVALAKAGDPRAGPALRDLGQDKNGQTQHAVLAALAFVNTPQATSAILEMTDISFEAIRHEAQSLAYERVLDGPIDPYLDALHHPNEEVRSEAILALSRTKDTRATQALIKSMVEDSSSLNRDGAAGSLAEIGDPVAVEPIIRAKRSEQVDGLAAVNALGHLGVTAVPFLLEMLKGREGNDTVPKVAAEGLGRIGHPSAIPGLIEALGHPFQGVRQDSAKALAQITGQDFGEDQAKWQAWYREQHDDQKRQ